MARTRTAPQSLLQPQPWSKSHADSFNPKQISTGFLAEIMQWHPWEGVMPVPAFCRLVSRNTCHIVVLLSTSLLAGCAVTNRDGAIVLKVAQASNENEQKNFLGRFESERRINNEYIQDLSEKQPDIRLHPSIIPAEKLEQELRVQTNSGLGPDLVIANSNQALSLLADGLTDPLKMTSELQKTISEEALKRVKTSDGSLAGQPVSQFIQLACFDKRKLAQAPKTLAELSAASGHDKVFGMVLNMDDLYWSVGSFGAGEALAHSLADKKTTTEADKRLTNWLRWLKTASYQQNIVFLRTQAALRAALISGDMSWISCWSNQLPQLRQALKEHLGVARLPDGTFGRATPITRLQVWALGKNSSKVQREGSLKLMKFVVQPWAQKTYALKFRIAYPVNPAAAQIVNKQLPGGLAEFSEAEYLRITRGDSIVAAIQKSPILKNAIESTLSDIIFDGLSPEKATAQIKTQFKMKQ